MPLTFSKPRTSPLVSFQSDSAVIVSSSVILNKLPLPSPVFVPA
ncbi:hypothetical protein [Spiroplasma endosymbiont of Monopis laevigella]